MLKNYLKIALRNIKKHKGFSFINIAGLAIGMACCILILLWVQDELSYDRFNTNLNDIYRIIKEETDEGGIRFTALTSPPLASALKTDYPEFIKATRFGNWGRRIVKYDDRIFNEDRYEHADPDFFEMFTFAFIKGDPSTALSDPYSIVLTEKMAEKYFGSEDPMGKSLNIENQFDVKVTGIIKNVPHNSSLQFDFLSPFVLLKEFIGEEPFSNWNFNAFSTFVQVEKNSRFQELNQKISGIYSKYDQGYIDVIVTLQPLRLIHLYSNILHDLDGLGDIKYVYIFSAMALFVLIIACINFMNLATARSGNRAKEVGIRKVAGAYKKDLIKQFLGESIFLSFIALLATVVLVEIFLPAFNWLSGKQLTMGYARNVSIFLGLFSIALITGIISGSYPAMFLSSFQPARVLKGAFRSGSRGALFRKILVVTQFSLSIFLIAVTIVVYKQLEYIRNKDMGYEREHLVYLRMVGDANQSYETIKQELQKGPNVLAVTASFALPTHIGSSPGSPDWEGRPPDKEIYMNVDFVDYGYFETFKMEMAQGRSFSKEFSTDAEEAYIVNEELVRQMGMESPVGKQFAFWDNWGKIIGVVKDFHFQSLHNQINPICFKINPDWLRFVFLRIKPDDIPATISFLEDTWKKLVPDYPFEYNFLDESFDRVYRAEGRMGTIINYFTGLAIFIACLGLFGLASFMAEKRTKEIGIRKILGATVSQIVLLLSKEFTKWVLVANIIAWPIAYFTMRRWLQTFAYSTGIGIWMFLLAAGMALMIALLTVSYQALKAALANPAKSLRYE